MEMEMDEQFLSYLTLINNNSNHKLKISVYWQVSPCFFPQEEVSGRSKYENFAFNLLVIGKI